MSVRAVDDKPSDTLVVVPGEGSWTGSSTLPHLHQHTSGRVRAVGGRSRSDWVVIAAIMAGVEEVEVVVAHRERATLRVGDVFLKIDADQTRTDVEVEAMAMAPVPTPEILWRKPPVLALAALPGTALGRLSEPSTASPAAWAAAGAAARTLHDAPLPPWPGRSLDEFGIAPRRRMRVARRQRRPSDRRGHAQPRGRRGCAPAVDTGVHPRRPAGRPRLRRR